ncbi:G-type lectin S-receptor-like serine/threonine-protein kinase LECRK2 [Populus alba x Populus x berolinensis]|nr:G-type lectin S-receptor-like serine/threonine-protein kinase LECRK2 [Populus alba x Populus x berolinensis]
MDFQLPYCFCFLLLLLLPFSTNAQTYRNISLGGSPLTAGSDNLSWTSPSREFSFGFQQVGDAGYLLAIWFNKIPERTIVWSANRNDLVQGGSRVQLTRDGELVLNDQSGRQIWIRPQSGGSGTAYAAMLDTGNFVVASQAGTNLWQSFDEPVDTLLPTQNLNSGAQLIAPYLEKNYSDGRFKFILQADGNLVLYTTRYPTTTSNAAYWSTQISIGSGYRVVFNQSGYMYLVDQNGTMLNSVFSNSVSMQDFYLRATIDYDGVFRQYAYPKTAYSSRRWTPIWSQPDNICQASFLSSGSGTCGFNSVCRLNSDRIPICECPGGYSLLDPSDQYGSCRPNYTQSCEEDEVAPVEDLYDFEELTNTDWPTSDYALLQPFTEERCRQSCLNDCMCAVAIFRSGNTCWKKKLPLSNGRVQTNLDGKALLKVRRSNVNPRSPYFPNNKKDRDGLMLVGSVFLGCSVFVNFLLVCAICMGFFFIYRRRTKRIPQKDGAVETNLRCFTYQELAEATEGFKEELGRGAFGVVYKAVKKLNNMAEDRVREFKTEVNVIGQTHHKNLPGWKERIQIAFGVARGLLYLHEEPQNILLDEYYNARISDFGLAKLLLLDQSHTHTAIRGTVDVYSYGVLLLEIICCRRNVDSKATIEEQAILTDWAYDCYREGTLDALDGSDTGALDDIEKLERFLMIAFWCIQEDPSLRPTMRKVTQMLEGVVEVPFPPCPCLLYAAS